MKGQYDITVRLHDFPAEAVKSSGCGLEIRYGFGMTPFGRCLAAETGEKLCYLVFCDSDEGECVESMKEYWWNKAVFKEDGVWAERIARDVFKPDGMSEGVDVILAGTPLQKRVWKELTDIEFGHTSSYSELAGFADKPKAVRAVASSVGRNPVSYLIPCHRIVRKDGGIGGYAWGVGRKRKILDWERQVSR